ncbi:MAG: LPXTG cell wall anchor domain-containing protein [Candidatus Dormibacteria bacterium]
MSVVQAATTPSTGSNLGTPFLFAGLLISLGAYIMRLRRKL